MGAEGEQKPTLDTKLQIIDRLIKMEALEHKIKGNRAGAAFDEEDED